MRAAASTASLTAHIALAAAVLFGTANAGRSHPRAPIEVPFVLPPAGSTSHEPSASSARPGPEIIRIPDLNGIPLPSIPFQSGAAPLAPTLSSTFSPTGGMPGSDQSDAWRTALGEQGPQVLTGPLPAYPELLRQAGVQGRVVLEALIDTTGRVRRDSILVVTATNPAFVAAARQALIATLFRPAVVGGKPIRMRVRVPYEFTIRDGAGHAR